LMLALCRALYPKYNIAALTNDIFTQEVRVFTWGELMYAGSGILGS
jgi:hypothetical protein